MGTLESFYEVALKAVAEGQGELFNLLPVEVQVLGDESWRPTVLWGVQRGEEGRGLATVLVPDPREKGLLPGVKQADIPLERVRFSEKVDAKTGAFIVGLLKASTLEQTCQQLMTREQRFAEYHLEWPGWRDAFMGEGETEDVDGGRADAWTTGRVSKWLKVSDRMGVARYLETGPCWVFDPTTETWWESIGIKGEDEHEVLMGVGPDLQRVSKNWVRWSSEWSETQKMAAAMTVWGLRATGLVAVLSKLGVETDKIKQFPMLVAVSDKGLGVLSAWREKNGVPETKAIVADMWGFSPAK